MRRRTLLPAVLCLGLALAGGCGGGSSSPPLPTVAAARTFRLVDLQPTRAVPPDRAETVGFTIREPSGEPLTTYRRGAGPHTGVHVIIVRDDLSQIIHRHPPIGRNGHVSLSVRFPAPGRYRLLVDAYPALGAGEPRNFQLTAPIRVSGASARHPLPAFRPTVTVDGVRFHVVGHPHVRALQATYLTVRVTEHGRAARLAPWFGALAHAIFFRARSLAYFHTHICGRSTPACAGGPGSAPISGRSTSPGVLRVGVLLPESGTWRLFLQAKVDGRVLTAPFTLQVR